MGDVKQWGIPYCGSKNKIVEWVAAHFPKRDNFYDLFLGGGAVTHYCAMNRMFKRYNVNDMSGMAVRLFNDAISGRIGDAPKYYERQEFYDVRYDNPFIGTIFSFGNNGVNYFCNYDKNEGYRAIYNYVVFGDKSGWTDFFGYEPSSCDDIPLESMEERYRAYRSGVDYDKVKERFPNNDLMTRYIRIKSLSEVGGVIDTRHDMTFHIGGYDDIVIKPNSLIYCDIPYSKTWGTNKYGQKNRKNTFDRDRFIEWCMEQTEPVIVSEYEMPEDKFICIGEKRRCSTMDSRHNTNFYIEKLFIPKHQYEQYEEIKPTLF